MSGIKFCSAQKVGFFAIFTFIAHKSYHMSDKIIFQTFILGSTKELNSK
jgi:hypothetical protein